MYISCLNTLKITSTGYKTLKRDIALLSLNLTLSITSLYGVSEFSGSLGILTKFRNFGDSNVKLTASPDNPEAIQYHATADGDIAAAGIMRIDKKRKKLET